MSHPILRLFDGFENTSPDLRDEVKTLQQELQKEGLDVGVDGQFGRDTEAAVKRFQQEHGLDDDGVVGQLTWAALLQEEPPKLAGRFPTTYAPSNPSLLEQLNEAGKYKSLIDTAAGQFDLPPCLIAGIGSRESHWGLALKPVGPAGTGDFSPRRSPARDRQGALPPDGGGFGRGLMQIDFDAHEFARTGNWRNPAENIAYGAKVLADNRAFFVRREPNLPSDRQLQAAIASYNAGAGNILRALRDGREIDFYTAGRDYSKDVLGRAGWFQIKGWV